LLLKNKNIVVCGGSGLIGKDLVKGIINSGGNAIIADLQDPEWRKFNSSSFILTDFNSPESVESLVNECQENFKKIDGLIISIYPRNKNYGKHFQNLEYADFIENVGLHLGGYFSALKYFLTLFKSQGHGNIINVSSIYGSFTPSFEIYNGTSMTVPIEYICAKSAIESMTKYLAKLYKQNNIRINNISPGGILDNQDPIFLENYNSRCASKGMLDSIDLVGSAIFLLSDMSEFINGQNIIIDDGFTL